MELPEAFLDQMAEILGNELDAFLASLAAPSPISVRWHPIKGPEKLTNGRPVPWCVRGRYLTDRPVFTLDPDYHAGAYYVQEASSMLIEAVLGSTLGSEAVAALDLCAAPGGKSTHLLGLLSEDSLLVSNEIHPQRYQILLENSTRQGFPNQALSRSAPRELARVWPERFGLILVDAPCSGEGLFRKDPAAIAHWSPTAIQKCVERQQDILHHAVQMLAPGGLLIYSTCTYNRKENEDQMRWLKSLYPLDVEETTLPGDWGVQPSDPGWRCFPHRLQGEGFYCCALRKRADGHPSIRKQSITTSKGAKSSPQPKADEILVSTFLERPDHFLIRQTVDGAWEAIPHRLYLAHGDILHSRSVLRSGIAMGTFRTPDRFIPDHGLALSTEVSSTLPAWELDRELALTFLRKEPMATVLPPPGLYLVRHGGRSLGWARVLPQRVNNLIPHHWRIRLQHRTDPAA